MTTQMAMFRIRVLPLNEDFAKNFLLLEALRFDGDWEEEELLPMLESVLKKDE